MTATGGREGRDAPQPRSPGSGVCLVVPLYNEQSRFDEFGQHLVDFIATQATGGELIFVDDGSDDATPRSSRSSSPKTRLGASR